MVYTQKTVRPDDYVRVNVVGAPVEGTIEGISFLRIVTNDGIKVSFPRTLMLTTTVSNYSLSEESPLVVSLNLSTNSMDLSKLKEEVVREMSTCFGSDELSGTYVRSIEGDKANVEVWVKVRTSRFLRERVRVVRGVSSICRELSLKLNSLTTTLIPHFKNMTAIA